MFSFRCLVTQIFNNTDTKFQLNDNIVFGWKAIKLNITLINKKTVANYFASRFRTVTFLNVQGNELLVPT